MRRQLSILVSAGTGTAQTELAAFDRALLEAGIGNFNLIPLSSVIPSGAQILEKRPDAAPEQWGDRLYVVLASQRTSVPHEQVWAGVGWIQDEANGRGLFVEHHGTSEAQVVEDIEASLSDLRASRPGETFGPPQFVSAGITCTERPVCAVVAAVYQAVPWD